MAVKFSNNAKTTLSSGITSSATSIAVVDASAWPTLGSGDHTLCTLAEAGDADALEIVKVTAISGNTLTVVRAQEGTTARSFSTADKAELRITAGIIEEAFSYAETDTLDAVTGRGATTTNAVTVGNLTSTGIDDNATSTAITIDSSQDATFAGNIGLTGTVDGRDVATDGTKLDGIESGATADQTNAEIRAAVEAATDSNVFTDADHTKLDGIEASADVTDTANVTNAGALMDSEVTNLAQVKAFNSSDYATAAQGTTANSALQNVVEDATPQLGGDLNLNSHDITGTGDISITGSIDLSGDVTSTNANLLAGNGNGLRFWDTGSYSVYMSATSDASFGGSITGAAASDYNMYFRMSGGTNRGFAFKSGTNVVAQIDGAGVLKANKILQSCTAGILGESSNAWPLEVLQPTVNADAMMTFHVASDYAVNFGLDGSTNKLSVGGYSLGANMYEIYHAGNPQTNITGNAATATTAAACSGNAASATTLGSYAPSTSATANTVAVRQANGYLFAQYYNSTGTFSTSPAASGMGVFTGTNGSDNYGRSYSAFAAGTLLGQAQQSLTASNYGHGVFGVYSPARYQHVWSMGAAYKTSADGTSAGNMYGVTWTHTNVGTGTNQAINGLSHQLQGRAGGNLWWALGAGIWTVGNVTAYSDISVKTNLERIPNALDKVMQINGYTYDRTDFVPDDVTGEMPETRQAGVVAQEVEKILPEVVSGEEGNKAVAYGNMVSLLIEAIKEQQGQIEELKAKIGELKGLKNATSD